MIIVYIIINVIAKSYEKTGPVEIQLDMPTEMLTKSR